MTENDRMVTTQWRVRRKKKGGEEERKKTNDADKNEPAATASRVIKICNGNGDARISQ